MRLSSVKFNIYEKSHHITFTVPLNRARHMDGLLGPVCYIQIDRYIHIWHIVY